MLVSSALLHPTLGLVVGLLCLIAALVVVNRRLAVDASSVRGPSVRKFPSLLEYILHWVSMSFTCLRNEKEELSKSLLISSVNYIG